MKKLFYGAGGLVVSVLLASCAVPYRPVNTSAYAYDKTVSAGPKAEVSYMDKMQLLTGNKRYARKEFKKGYTAVAVKVTNLSQEKLQLTKENFKISANGVAVTAVPPEQYAKAVRQYSATYLLHTLWGPWQYSYYENPPPGHSEFDFLPIGAIVGLGNTILAASANSRQRTLLMNNQIVGLTVEPGQTVYGIITLRGSGLEALTFEIVN